MNHEINFKRTREQRIKHGQSRIRGVRNGTPAYLSWASMISRCYYKKGRAYKNYGAKGIRVCDSWRASFEAFYADMGDRPEGTTLGRLEGKDDYSPTNCEWQDNKTQSRNRNNNHLISYAGRTQTLEDWSRETNIYRETLRQRLIRGWPIGKALTHPVRRQKNNATTNLK